MSYPLAVDIDSWHLADTPVDSVRDSLENFNFDRCVEHTPLGEVWQVRSPNNKLFLAHFLSPADRKVIESFLSRLKEIKVKGLASFSVMRTREEHTILLTEVEGVTLKEKFQQYWKRALPGIPRRELIGYLMKVARTLDTIYDAHRLQHLALNPKRILVNEDQVQVTGFGLAELMWGPLKQPILSLNPQYSAPEIFRQRISPNCDQCSLALMYVSLLTGVHPMRNWERSGSVQLPKTLDVSMLSSADRAIVLKALDSNPRQRFINATAFLEALEKAGSMEREPCALTKLLVGNRTAPDKAIFSLESFVHNLVGMAIKEQNSSTTASGIQFRIEPGRKIEHRLGLGVPPAKLFEKVGEFCQSMNASPTHFDDQRILLQVTVPATFWRRILNKRVGLEIEVQVVPAVNGNAEIAVVVRPFGCGREQAVQLLQEEGVRLLEELQKYLQQGENKRRSPRFACQQRIVLSPVMNGNDLAAPIEGVTKDVSSTGVGLIIPSAIDAAHLYLNLPQVNELAPYSGLAEVVRIRELPDGWFEVGAQFATDQAAIRR